MKEPSDLLEDLHVQKFLELTKRAGLEHKINNVSDVTIFAPSDEAFNGKPNKTSSNIFFPFLIENSI